MSTTSDSLCRILLVFCLFGCVPKAWSQLLETDFIPQVSATCKAGHMNIRVNFNGSFVGTIHARDYRTPSCMKNGDGSKSATLDINLLAQPGAPDYCGPLVNNKTEERSLPIAVRIHRTLELADDKFYVITCGKAGFLNTSLVSLRLTEGTRKVIEAVYHRSYTLKVEILRPDSTYGFRVKNCLAFNRPNSTEQLVDQRGCPVGNIIDPFVYDEKKGIAEAQIKSMFRFPDNSEVHIQ
ncbi:uncharacterized protein LOC108905126, partial [Anoplophora glabripennis]|uniref:uncharacterized protein LOC108905126 n=1 Tax=Anoplophora glabripennis TaxID=217634 RepID=UPI0008759679